MRANFVLQSFKSLKNIPKFFEIPFRTHLVTAVRKNRNFVSTQNSRNVHSVHFSRPCTIGHFIFLCIMVLRLNNTFKRGTRDTGARVKSNSASFFLDIDSSFNKLLLQKEELEQKHLHLLQIVESEKTAKWQYTQQCEELASEIKKLRAEVKYQLCFIYLPHDIFVGNSIPYVACIFISTLLLRYE